MLELINKRKWNSKVFDTGKMAAKVLESDHDRPIYSTKLQNGLHDIEPDGSFVEVNKKFMDYEVGVSTDKIIRNRCGEVRISDTGSASKDLAKIKTKRDCGISLKLKGIRTYGPFFDDLKSCYYTTNEGIILRYYPHYKGVSIVVEIANPQTASNVYRFSLKEYGCDYTYEEINGAIKCISSTGKDDIHIKATYAIDGSGDYGSVHMRLGDVVNGYQEVEKVIAPVWLGNAEAPVLSDPDITIEDGVDGGVIEDNFILSNDPTTNYGTFTAIYIRNYSANERSSVVYVDISSLAGATPLSGKFLCATTAYSGAAFDSKAFKLSKRFVETESTWNEYESGSSWETGGAKGVTDRAAIEECTFITIHSIGEVVDVPITVDTLTEWLTSNDGLLMESVTLANNAYWACGSAEHSTTPIQFYMEYTEGAVAGIPRIAGMFGIGKMGIR